MTKTIIASGLAALILPSLALADDHMGPPPPPGAQGTFNGAMHVQFEGGGAQGEVQFQGGGMMQGDGEEGDWRGPASGTRPMDDASDTPSYMRGEKRGIEDHFGTTTPPGQLASGTRPMFIHEDEGSSSESSFRDFVPMFFRWLFGAPASTTAPDLRAQIEASSSASVTASSSAQLPPGRGEQGQNEDNNQAPGNFIQALFRSLGGLFGR